jgi:hypothetical protein
LTKKDETAKWTNHFPFVEMLQQYSNFEMPWIGFMGFLPFTIERRVATNTLIELGCPGDGDTAE